MTDITLESLENDLASTAPDDTARFSGAKMRALLQLVTPIKSPKAYKLRLVHDIAIQDETILTSDEVRLLLTFLREIKRRRAGLPA